MLLPGAKRLADETGNDGVKYPEHRIVYEYVRGIGGRQVGDVAVWRNPQDRIPEGAGAAMMQCKSSRPLALPHEPPGCVIT